MSVDLDQRKIYVFVREDLPAGQDDIQSNHACYHAGLEYARAMGKAGLDFGGIPYMVTIGCPTIKSMRKAQLKIEEANIGHYVMTDTDVDPLPTAIATYPLDHVQKEVLREYRLRKYAPRAAPGAGFNAEGSANAGVAPSPERSVVSNGEVAGSYPAASSNSKEVGHGG